MLGSSAVVDQAPDQERHEQQRAGQRERDGRRRRPPPPAAPQRPGARDPAEQRAVGPGQRREHGDAAGHRELRRPFGDGERADQQRRQQHEQQRLEPARCEVLQVLVQRHADRGERQEGDLAGGGRRQPFADAHGHHNQRAVAQHAEHLRKPHGVEAAADRERAQQRPREVGVALDAFADVVDEAVAVREVLGVAERDERVVADPGALRGERHREHGGQRGDHDARLARRQGADHRRNASNRARRAASSLTSK
ncbi:MAG: hypothetical protein KDC48_14080 [Planctomycetes bacterium]|nr:hypothetical protein [Planctomycetota bacterium]